MDVSDKLANAMIHIFKDIIDKTFIRYQYKYISPKEIEHRILESIYYSVIDVIAQNDTEIADRIYYTYRSKFPDFFDGKLYDEMNYIGELFMITHWALGQFPTPYTRKFMKEIEDYYQSKISTCQQIAKEEH